LARGLALDPHQQFAARRMAASAEAAEQMQPGRLLRIGRGQYALRSLIDELAR
jgi:hypothetical protein